MRHRLVPRIAALTVVVGLVVVVVGLLMATVWAPERSSTVRLSPGDAPFVLTAPGFLAMDGSTVTVTATAGAAPVFLGIARAEDATSYLGDAPRRSVIGVTSRSEAISTMAGGGTAPPSPGTVDIWVERTTGERRAALTWTTRAGAWSLIAASDGTAAAARDLTFTWQLPAHRSSAPAVIALGVLLVVSGAIGLALFLVPGRLDFSAVPADEPPVPAADRPRDPSLERTP